MSAPRPDRERDRQIHEMLLGAYERMDAPDGSWEQVSRRARRRKWAKAGLTAAAVIVLAAGAIPAVIGVRDHNGGDQTLTPAGPSRAAERPVITPTTRPSPRQSSSPVSTAKPVTTAPYSPPASTPVAPYGGSLAGFDPVSVSFVSPTVGYAWGTVGASKQGVVAETLNLGHTWFRLSSAPGVSADVTNDGNGDGQIRFVTGTVGYVFGSSLWVTLDAGKSWHQLPLTARGYVVDLEAGAQQAWALVRTSGSPSSGTLQLFHAMPGSPTLAPVRAVSPATGVPSVGSIAVNELVTNDRKIPSVDVLVGNSAFWNSPNGSTWHEHSSPCPTGTVSALVAAAAANTTAAVAACGAQLSGDSQTKQVWATTTAGKQWNHTPTAPSSEGHLSSFSDGVGNDLILGETRGNAQLSRNGGKSWQATAAGPNGSLPLSFVGFISQSQVVALVDRGNAHVGGFAVSGDTGRDWTDTPFPE